MKEFVTRQELERLVCSERFREAVASAMLAKWGKELCENMGFRRGSSDGVDRASPSSTGASLGPWWVRHEVWPEFEGDLSQLPFLLATRPEPGRTYPGRFLDTGLRVLYGLLLEGAC